MPIIIDGQKFSSKDLEGTDLKALDDFLRKNKLNAGLIIYRDSEGWNICGVWKNTTGKQHLNSIANQITEILDL